VAIHNESFAQQPAPRPEPIYCSATGVEMPAFEPLQGNERIPRELIQFNDFRVFFGLASRRKGTVERASAAAKNL